MKTELPWKMNKNIQLQRLFVMFCTKKNFKIMNWIHKIKKIKSNPFQQILIPSKEESNLQNCFISPLPFITQRHLLLYSFCQCSCLLNFHREIQKIYNFPDICDKETTLLSLSMHLMTKINKYNFFIHGVFWQSGGRYKTQTTLVHSHKKFVELRHNSVNERETRGKVHT